MARSLPPTRTEGARGPGAGLVARSTPIGGWLENDRVLGFILLAPAFLVLLAFVAYPFLYGIWLSLTDTRIGQAGTFVGLQNFVAQFEDSTFRRAVVNTFEYTIVTGVFKFFLGLAVAVILNQTYRGRRFVRAIVLLPWIVPTVLSTLSWLWMFDSLFSVINWTLRLVGITGPVWLGEGHWPMISVMIVNIWRGTPFFAICFLAGMQTVPDELYDAAKVDGANGWQRFWRITFPMLIPVTTVVTLLTVILTFGDFQLVYALTRGGPAHYTEIFGTFAYWMGINAGQLGVGASISLTMFPVLALVVFLTLRALRRD